LPVLLHSWTRILEGRTDCSAAQAESGLEQAAAGRGFPFFGQFNFGTKAALPRMYTGVDPHGEPFMTDISSAASRVPLLERDQVPAEIAALYDKLDADRGCVPNMFKVLAQVPGLALGIPALLKPLMGEGALAGWYKELVATRVASLNRCAYCVSAHRYLALQRGATAEQVASLDDATTDGYERGPFNEKEKAGLRYASLLHVSGHAIDDAAFAAVSLHFDTAERIELTAVAAAFEMFSRFNSALRIPVTPLPE
jgi:uncharacterized peroxidase-related enzyme